MHSVHRAHCDVIIKAFKIYAIKKTGVLTIVILCHYNVTLVPGPGSKNDRGYKQNEIGPSSPQTTFNKDAPRKALSRVGLNFFVHTTIMCSHVHSTRYKTGKKDRIQVV